MTIRNVRKSLATMEDLQQGVGLVSQRRSGSDYTLGMMDVPYAVNSEAAMSALDVAIFSRARVYSALDTSLDFVYDPAAIAGIISNTGPGFWIPLNLVEGGGFETVWIGDSWDLNDPNLVDTSIITYCPISNIPSSWPQALGTFGVFGEFSSPYAGGGEATEPLGVIVLTQGRQVDFPGATTSVGAPLRGAIQTLVVASGRPFGDDLPPEMYIRNYHFDNDRMQPAWTNVNTTFADSSVTGTIKLRLSGSNAFISTGTANP